MGLTGLTGKKAERRNRSLHGIRIKVLTLVVFSAAVPALVVSAASFLTAREILVDKVSHQLSQQASAAADLVKLWFDERTYDTEVFANSFVVSENLERFQTTEKTPGREGSAVAKDRIAEYLSQVQGRYNLYKSLLVLDAKGALVARAGDPLEAEMLEPVLAETDGSRSSIKRHQDEFLFCARSAIRGRNNERLGTLVTVGRLGDLSRHLEVGLASGGGHLRVMNEEGALVFASGAPRTGEPTEQASEGVRRVLSGGDRALGPSSQEVSEYLDASGRRVLGAFRFLSSSRLALVVEMDVDSAFAAVHRLRYFNLLASLLAVGVMSALGYALVVSLTRPIEELILGAQAVSQGNYGVAIAVRSRDEVGYLARVFNQMTEALRESHAALERVSTTDELTGLHNRRQLTRALGAELGRAVRTREPMSILMLDIDHFKSYNDRFGHLQGDRLLHELGLLLAKRVRATDVAARYGGEEFVVILADSDKAQAERKAEQLRRDCESELSAGEAPGVTLSIGVASFPDDGVTEQELLRRADEALYRAKHLGRNRVVVWASTQELSA